MWKHVSANYPDFPRSPFGGPMRKKLTGADIPEIRELHKLGVSLSEIGRIKGVHSATISEIIAGKTWVNY